MLKHLMICVTLAMMLFAMLSPAEVRAGPGCPSTETLQDVCTAATPAAPTRSGAGAGSGAEKPCLSCVLTSGPTLMQPSHDSLRLRLTVAGRDAVGRTVPPDRRPPRA